MDSDPKVLDIKDFRQKAHHMVDFIADYYRNIEKLPVQSQVPRGYLKNLLPERAPELPECFDDVCTDVHEKIIPGMTHWMSPRFFGYFPTSGSTAGYLGDLLSAGLNVPGFNWLASPAATELEVIVLDWLAGLLNLSKCFRSGIIQGTVSDAVLLALLAARTRALARNGLQDFSRLAIYSSDQMHSSLHKACVVVGIPSCNVIILPTYKRDQYAFSPKVLRKAIHQGIASGLIPCFLGATIGATSSGAIDPISRLGDIAMEYGMWYHVDAAYGGNACICPEYQHYLNGVEKADSFNVNLHDGLLTNFSCSPIWFKDTKDLVSTLSTKPEYLETKVNAPIDFKDWEIPLGRRFRSLKVWFIMRLHGASGLRTSIRKHINLARHFATLVSEDPRFEVVLPQIFGLVCFRLRPVKDGDDGHDINSKLLATLNSSGKMFITHAVVSGVYMLRMAIGATLTELVHVNAAWETIQSVVDLLLSAKTFV